MTRRFLSINPVNTFVDVCSKLQRPTVCERLKEMRLYKCLKSDGCSRKEPDFGLRSTDQHIVVLSDLFTTDETVRWRIQFHLCFHLQLLINNNYRCIISCCSVKPNISVLVFVFFLKKKMKMSF